MKTLRFHLQSSTGTGCRAEVDTVTLRAWGGAVIQSGGNRSYCSFDGAHVEIRASGRLRVFSIGEGFACFQQRLVSVVSGAACEAPDRCAAKIAAPRCVVCERAFSDASHSLVIGEARVDLCCPHCADSFRRARKILDHLESSTPRQRGDRNR